MALTTVLRLASRVPLQSRGARIALLLCTVLLTGVVIYGGARVMQQRRLLQDLSRYEVTWMATQAVLEYAQLEGAVGAYATGAGGVDQEDVRLHLHNVLGHVQLLERREMAAFLAIRPELRPLIQEIKVTTEKARPLVEALAGPGGPAGLLSLLMPLDRPLGTLAMAARDYSEQLVTRDLDRLGQLFWSMAVLVVLLIGCSLGLAGLAARHNRLLVRANAHVRNLNRHLRGSSLALAGAMQEVTVQNKVLQQRDTALETQNARFDAALNNMSQALLMVDAGQRLIVGNVRYAALFGLDEGAMAPGTHVDALAQLMQQAGRYSAGTIESIWVQQGALAVAAESGFFVHEDGGGRALAVSQQPMADGGWVATYEDITERRRAEAQIRHMANHDALTNLPNRRMFHARLREWLGQMNRKGDGLAVHCIDLDLFKNVNDTLGHPAGDALLEAVGRRLRTCVRQTDMVARLGGDEFAILQCAATANEAAELAMRVLHAIQEPYDLDGRRAVVGASIGIAMGADGAWDADRLFCNADLALYRSKAEGRGTFRFFEPHMEADQEARYSIELDLREALVRRELQVHYQPLFDLGHNRISGYEALLRWQHPTRGMVMPGLFIPVAEEIGLITAMGEFVLRQACKDAASWSAPVKVAVNLSPVQFRSPDLVQVVIAALADAGLAAPRLELEITESVLLQDTEQVPVILHKLRALGVRTVLDDFGTGYSSLSYLRSFPFDKIKVDQSFVRDMGARPDCLAIVDSISGLARRLGMSTTAEGVETEEQLQQLRLSGFTEVQGYLLGRPAPNAVIPSMPPADAKMVAAE